MKRKVIYYLIFIIGIHSCTKKSESEITSIISGKVIDPFTHKPLIGVPIALWRKPFLGDDYIVEKEYTDSSGLYRIQTTKVFNSISLIDYTKDDLYAYYDLEGNPHVYQVGLKEIEYYKELSVDFFDYASGGAIKLNVNVSSNVLNDDSLSISIYDDKLRRNWFSVCLYDNDLRKKEKFNFYKYLRANDSLLIKITKNSNGKIQDKDFKIFVKPFVLDSVQIEF